MFHCAKLGVDPWTGCVPKSAALVPFHQFNSPNLSMLNMAGSIADGPQLNGVNGNNPHADSPFVPIELNTFTTVVVNQE